MKQAVPWLCSSAHQHSLDHYFSVTHFLESRRYNRLSDYESRLTELDEDEDDEDDIDDWGLGDR